MRLLQRIASYWRGEWAALRLLLGQFPAHEIALMLGLSVAFCLFAMSIEATKPIKIRYVVVENPSSPPGIVIKEPPPPPEGDLK